MPDHIAICGLAPSEKRLNADLVRQDGGECWGLPWSRFSHRYDMHFEMHDRSIFELRGEEYIQQLQESAVPTFMQKEHEDIRNSIEYPLLDAIAHTHGDYFCSSIAYMLAYALMVGPKEVSIWGVDVSTGTEFEKERACNEYLIGLLRGRGTTVWIADGSSMFTFSPVNNYLDHKVEYTDRYGWAPVKVSSS